SNPTIFENVMIDSTNITEVHFKGMYLESLGNSTIQNVSIMDSGNYGYRDTSSEGSWGSGLQINLKYGDYENIILDNLQIVNSGWSNQGGGAGVTTLADQVGS